MKEKHFYYLFLRYIVLIVIALNINLIYDLLLPITLYASYFLIHLFYQDALISGPSTISLGSSDISLIAACIAGSAYLLLIILNLSTPMNKKQRFYSLLFMIGLFFILNIMRIALFSHLSASGSSYFEELHKLSWYFASTILVVMIWFSGIKIYKIKGIPFFTDGKDIIYSGKTRKRQ